MTGFLMVSSTPTAGCAVGFERRSDVRVCVRTCEPQGEYREPGLQENSVRNFTGRQILYWAPFQILVLRRGFVILYPFNRFSGQQPKRGVFCRFLRVFAALLSIFWQCVGQYKCGFLTILVWQFAKILSSEQTNRHGRGENSWYNRRI